MKNINPKYFNAFLAVVESNSFSHAANRAYMTQANVSKHIQALEEQLGHKLFIRTNKNPVITEAGKCLLDYINKVNELNAELLLEITGNKQSMKGIVRYALTHSGLVSDSFPKLQESWTKFQNIEMNISIDTPENIITGILESTLDFGFMSKNNLQNPKLSYHICGQEEYVMVDRNRDLINSIINTESLLTNKYIEYPAMRDHFDDWRALFFPEADVVNSGSLYYGGRTNNMESAVLMVLGGLGSSIFPRSCIQQYIDTGQLHEWKASKPQAFYKDIYMVKLTTHELPKRVNVLIDFFINSTQPEETSETTEAENTV